MLATITLMAASSCNSKKDDVEESYAPSSSMAVTSFKLKANSDVAPDLDSYFFAIDLDRGVIFNADSLPKGTDVSALVAQISYASTAQSLTVSMTGGKTREGEFDYKASPSEPIDFTGRVALKVVSQGGLHNKEYEVKVNVHRQDPARLLWSGTDIVAPLPSRMAGPLVQRTVEALGRTLCFVEEADGSFTLSEAPTGETTWTKTDAGNALAALDLRSITPSGDGRRLFALERGTGKLKESTDGLTWQDCGQAWSRILGGYMEGAVGLSADGSRHLSQPEGMTPESAVTNDFPVSGMTNAVAVKTQWSQSPTLLLAGGRLSDGSLTSSVWGFDGQTWRKLCSQAFPALEGAMLIPYWTGMPGAKAWAPDDRDAWLLVGGRLADGTPNREIRHSVDNGLSWTPGGEELTVPERLGALLQADALVSLNPRREPAWPGNSRATNPTNVTVEGTEILWNCPEIWFFGGEEPQTGTLRNELVRATLARFTFTPQI